MEENHQRRVAASVTVPSRQSNTVGLSDEQQATLGINGRRLNVALGSRNVDACDKDLELDDACQTLRFPCAVTLRLEVHHGVSMVVREHVQRRVAKVTTRQSHNPKAKKVAMKRQPRMPLPIEQ